MTDLTPTLANDRAAVHRALQHLAAASFELGGARAELMHAVASYDTQKVTPGLDSLAGGIDRVAELLNALLANDRRTA